jgi:large subunit ribosomal protein L10
MALTKEKKKSIVQNIQEAIRSATTVVFVQFQKLTVADANTMRRELRKDNVSYVVAKKTLLRRALADGKVEGALPELPGEIAIAYLSARDAQAGGSDSIAPARGIEVFVKKYKDSIAIVGGIFNGAYMDKASMQEIATIPPLQTLRAQFVQLINSPIQRLAVVLNAVAEQKK